MRTHESRHKANISREGEKSVKSGSRPEMRSTIAQEFVPHSEWSKNMRAAKGVFISDTLEALPPVKKIH